MTKKLLEAGLIVAVVVAVGGFGGTGPISWAIAQGILLLLGLALAIGVAPARWSVPVLGPAVLALWVVFHWLSSKRHPLGFDAYTIRSAAIDLATDFVAFYVTLQVCRDGKAKVRLVQALIALGGLEALYGLFQYLARWPYIFNYEKQFYRGSATGTYINHNHFAGFLEMVLPLVLCLTLYSWRKAAQSMDEPASAAMVRFLGQPEAQKGLLGLLAGVVMFLAIIFSFSRMGLIACLTSLGLMGATLALGKRRRAASVAVVFHLVVIGVVAASWIGVEPVVSHFERLPENESWSMAGQGRVAIWGDTIRLIRDHPWTGVGLGCFAESFTQFQTVWLTARVNHAHNDYLEAAAELGIPGAILLFGMFFVVVLQSLRTFLAGQDHLTRAIALGAFGGIIAVLTHSIADFNLHIPANALVFSVLLGLGYSGKAGLYGELLPPRPEG